MEFLKQKRSPNISRSRKAQAFVVEAPSPPQPKDEIYSLELKPFSKFPHIMFDKVRVGSSKVQTLIIHNPLTTAQSVCIEKFPSDQGFSINEVRYHIPALAQIEVQITWKPEKSASCRGTVMFRTSTGTRAQAYLHGIACSPKKRKKKWDDKCIDQQTLKVPTKKVKEGVIEGKENINVLNSKNSDFEVQWKKPDFLPKKASDDTSDSPLRRQTYVVDSFIQTSQIRAMVPNETFCTAIDGSKGVSNEDKFSHGSKFRESLALQNFSVQEKCEESKQRLVNDTVEVFNDSLENNLKESSFELNETGVGSRDFTCDSLVDFSSNYNRQSNFSVSECFDSNRKGLKGGYHEEDAKKTTECQTPFFLLSQCISKSSSPPDLNFKTCDLTTPQSALESRIVNSEEAKLNETQKPDFKNLQQKFKVPLCHDMDPSLVEENSSSLAFEIKCGKMQSVTSLSPAKLIDKVKRKTMILSNRKLQSTQLREKLLSTSSLSIRERVKVKTPHRKVDKDRRPSKYLPKRLTLTKVKASDRVYQRNPFATLNAYYDQYWMEKQEIAFTNWLNFILTPNDDFQSSEEIQVNSAEIWMESMKDTAPIHAPSKEELSFKTYTAAKQLNRLRKSACQLYQSEELSGTIKKVEKEVDMKKLCIRSDRAIHADLGIKKEMLEMLLSYNPLWLRIGLETVYGEMISLVNNRDIVGLSRFIINRFLSNPELVAKYAHSSVINYFKPGFEENMKSFTLKKFLLLVYFLDVAKRKYLIDHNPCLFSKKSKYKSSRDLLITFSREYLSGEGDITKHLRYLGCVVKHQQTPIEEFDYAVKNIAVDLRCGLRLGRAVELLLQDWSISKTLRANTLNRLTKIHNNDFIFKALQKTGIEIEGNIDPRDIVDGNREKTLSLLWQIIFKTQVSLKVNLEALKKENSYLRRSLKLNADCAAFNAMFAGEANAESLEYDFLNSRLYKENEVIQQLFQWCQNVCAHYGVKVYNFTSSFSDGRALCYLLHHYHPNLLPVNLIKTKTTSSYFEEQMENVEDENCPFLPEERQMKSKVLDDCLKNERGNLNVVLQKAQEIGQIPILSFPTDLSNTLPDEKVIITLVSYINIRLMELSVEIRAARTILYAYRKWRLRKRQKELQVKIEAVIVIQRFWRNHKEQQLIELRNKSAIILQKAWRMYSAKQQLQALKKALYLNLLNDNATVIQAAYKGHKTRKHFLLCRKSAIVLQSHIRKWLARTQFIKLKLVVVKIQSIHQARVLGRRQRQKFLQLKKSCTLLQACIRGMQFRKKLDSQKSAVIVLQRYTRMWLARKRYLKLKKACLCIQERLRLALLGREHVKTFQKARQSALIIQRWFSAVRKAKLEHKSATKIQCWFKQVMERKKYLRLRSSIITIQLWWKAVFIGHRTRSLYLENRKRVILLQACFRKRVAKRAFDRKKMSAIVIQKYVRKTIQCKQYCRMRKSSITIQRWWQNILFSCQIRNEYISYRCSVVKIQTFWRMYSSRKTFVETKRAAFVVERYRIGKMQRKAFLCLKEKCVEIQSCFRGYICRKRYHALKNAVVSIQRFFRSYLVRKTYLKKKNCTVKIQQYYRSYLQMCKDKQNYLTMISGFTRLQAVYRGVKDRQKINALHERACLIQKSYRKYIARKHYLTLKKACTVIQQKYRAYALMKIEFQKYNEMKTSIILIQATLKCIHSRKAYLAKKEAAIKIQSYVRMIICRKSYVNTYQKIVFIQKTYKAKRLRNIQMSVYNETRKRVIFLQSKVRCFIARKTYNKLKSACILVQSVVRMWLLRTQFTRLQDAATVIQRWYRSLQVGRKTRKEYLTLKNATIKVQSAYRMNKELKKYRKILHSVLFIQRKFTALLVGRKERQRYLLLRKSSIAIQSFIRMSIVRKKFLKMRNACIAVQSFYRMYSARNSYLQAKRAASVVQKHFRAWKIGKEKREHYLQMKHSATMIQAYYHGYIMKREYNLKKKACITIQSFYRMYSACKSYHQTKRAACIVQKQFRAWKLGKEKREHYVEMKRSATMIQACYRGYIMKREYFLKKKACIVIQSYYRMYSARKSYLQAKRAASVVQKHFRAWKLGTETRKDYVQMKQSATRIQACYRGYITKRQYNLKKKACIVIQSYYRMYSARNSYLQAKRAASVVQKHFRAWKLGTETRKDYVQMKQSATRIQACYRGYITKRQYNLKKKACIVIQSFYKMCSARKSYHQTKRAACVVQKHFRAWKVGKEKHEHYVWMKHSATVIQAFYRCHVMKREYILKKKACIMIQSFYRMHSARKSYLQAKRAASVVQKHFRAWKLGTETRKDYVQMKHSATVIQSVYRGYVMKRKYNLKRKACITVQKYTRRFIARKHFSSQRNAAITLQNRVRAFLLGKETRKQYENDKRKLIIIQAVVKGWLARRNIAKLHCSATKIQNTYKSYLCRKTFLLKKRSVVMIQRNYKSYVLRKKLHLFFLKLRNSSTVIQSAWRGYKTRCDFKRKLNAVILLQSQVRKVLLRKQYLRTKQSAVTIQRKYRAYKLGSVQFQLYQQQRKSCIIIQSVWRAFRAKSEYKSKVAAAILLQCHVRKILLRRKYVAMQHSAITIQRHYLAFKAGRKEFHVYQMKRTSCIKIQAVWRGFTTRKQLTRQRNAAVYIQKHFRQWIQRREEQKSLGLISKQQHEWYLGFRANLVAFQICARQYLQRRERSALLIQSYYRMWLAQRHFRKLKAVIKIQAFWRGYETRKNVADSRIMALRQNLKKCGAIKKNILKTRTTRALETLLTNRNLRAILNALQELDICTQLSPVCCERLEQSEGLSIIIDLVRSCNRSVPHKELIKVSTNILLNIAKYKKTVNSIWADPKVLATILELMKIYRENGQDIFTKCCTLFYIFCHDQEKARILKNNSQFCEQIKSLHNLLMRKLNIEEKRSKSTVSSQSSFIKRWISSNSRESLPIDPDWLLGHNRRRSFKDPYTAISALMQALDLQPKVS